MRCNCGFNPRELTYTVSHDDGKVILTTNEAYPRAVVGDTMKEAAKRLADKTGAFVFYNEEPSHAKS